MMKHIPTFEQFINENITELYNRTSNKYKTQNVEWDDIKPGDYIADGPNVGEISQVINNTSKGFTLKRVWNNVRKKDGEEFFIPHHHDALKDHPKSIVKVLNYVNESIDESKIGEIHIMAQESDSFTAFRKKFMDEYGKPKSVKELKELEAWLQTVWNENK